MLPKRLMILLFSSTRHMCALLCFASLVHPIKVSASETWREVFDPYKVLTINLLMDTADWDRVRFDQPSQSESWVPQLAIAQFWAEGETPITVSVRRKGESDIPLPEGNPEKVSLKIDINGPVPGQKWRGLTKLSLENGSDNPLTEGFAWVLHRLAWEGGVYGYEAAHSGWVRLYINGQLKGIFVNAEQRDAQFLRNHGYSKESGTWLYKVDGSSTLDVGIGKSPAYTHLCFPPFNSGPGGGAGGGGQGGCTQPNLESDLPRWIDLRGLFTLAAVNAFAENGDDLFSHSGKNSYAVDFDPPFPRTRLYFPWDLDTTIYQGNKSIYGNEPYQVQLLMHPWFQRVYEQLMRDLLNGPFSAAALHAVVNRLQTNLGAAFDDDPYVYPSGSTSVFQDLHKWVDRRVTNVWSQLLQPWIPRPQLSQAGGEVVAGFNLTISAPIGQVYYTTDGTDPRAPGGTLAASAQLYSGPVLIEQPTQVIARAFDGTTWSALPVIASFSIARYANAMRLTEIMYHPRAGSLGEDEYEFVELKNTGSTTLDLTGCSFEGIDFTFNSPTLVASGAFVVLARNAAAFTNRYPNVPLTGVYWGKLSDSGEKIRLRDPQGNTILSVDYSDEPPWALGPDVLGHSLVLADASADPSKPESWRGSSNIDGSPGADDPAPSYTPGVVINEVLAHTDPPLEDAIELFNSASVAVDISGWFLSDDLVRTNAAGAFDLKKYRIPDGTILQPGDYKVFYARDFQTGNNRVPFGLSEFGETVYLSSADATGKLTGFIHGATFGPTANGVSVGRWITSTGVDFTPLTRVTFGSSGSGAQNSEPRVGPVVINEIMYNPDGGGAEFVELLNITTGPVNLAGWRLAGCDFTFPPGSTIPAGGLVLVLNTNAVSAAAFAAANAVPGSVTIHSHSFVLENNGETLRLDEPNLTALEPPYQVDRVRYNDKSPWPTEADGHGPSLERFAAGQYGNDPINWRTVSSGGSPGRLNQFLAGIGVAKQSAWKYNDLGSDLGTAWRLQDYSDSSWPDGDGPLGYGVEGLGSVLSGGTGSSPKPITVYLRKKFVINDPVSYIANLQLDAMYDDGFVLYLNGEEVLRSAAMPTGLITAKTTTTAGYNSMGYERFDLSAFSGLLRLGENVLCAEVHQESASGDDLLWDALLTYDVSTEPTLPAPAITPPGGYFDNPLEVVITPAPADAVVYFTLDGTDPDTTTTRYTGPIALQSSCELRARTYYPGYNESPVSIANFFVGVPGRLEVSPAPAAISLGVMGGPFSPASHVFTLTNSGGASLNWAVSKAEEWLSLSPESGNLPAGAAANVAVAINTNANLLTPATYTNTVSFLNTTIGALSSSAVELHVKPLNLMIQRTQDALEILMDGNYLQTYVIERSSNLEHWTPVTTNSPGHDGSIRLLLPDSGASPRYFRARTY